MPDFNKQTLETSNFTAKIIVFDSLDLCAVFLSGQMESHLASQLREKVYSTTIGKRYNYLVDLEGLTSISSNGLGFLMYLAKNKRDFVYISRPHSAIIQPFNLLGIGHLFLYYHSLEDLERQHGFPQAALSVLWMEKKVLSATLHQKQWVKILKEHLASRELTKEIQSLSAYLEAAEKQNPITMPADDKFTSILYRFLERAFAEYEEAGGQNLEAATLELIAKELMANAVKHGYNYQSGGQIEAGYRIENGHLEITFTDHGRGYNPRPNGDDSLPSAGLEMLRKIFDRLEISVPPQRLAEGLVLGPGTLVRMIKTAGAALTGPQPSKSWWQKIKTWLGGR